ncbi:7256_t:CDS:2, partial [Gigaspora margarita]
GLSKIRNMDHMNKVKVPEKESEDNKSAGVNNSDKMIEGEEDNSKNKEEKEQPERELVEIKKEFLLNWNQSQKRKKEEFKLDDLSKLDSKVIQNIGHPKNSKVVISEDSDESMNAADIDNEIVDCLFDLGGKCLSKHPV